MEEFLALVPPEPPEDRFSGGPPENVSKARWDHEGSEIIVVNDDILRALGYGRHETARMIRHFYERGLLRIVAYPHHFRLELTAGRIRKISVSPRDLLKDFKERSR